MGLSILLQASNKHVAIGRSSNNTSETNGNPRKRQETAATNSPSYLSAGKLSSRCLISLYQVNSWGLLSAITSWSPCFGLALAACANRMGPGCYNTFQFDSTELALSPCAVDCGSWGPRLRFQCRRSPGEHPTSWFAKYHSGHFRKIADSD